MREVVAGAGAHKGHVGCMWDGSNTLREGAGHVRGAGVCPEDGACPGWSWGNSSCVTICGAVRLDVGVAKTHSWGLDACAKHGGHGRHDVVAATKQGEDAHVGSDSEAEVDRAAVFSERCRPHAPPW